MSQCSERQIDLPQNIRATCWWLSVNLALFHKERDDLRSSLASSSGDSTEGAKVKEAYTSIYNYYLGKAGGMTKENIEIFRTTSTDLKTLFPIDPNKKFKFDIAGSSFQDAQEYFSSLKNQDLLNNIFFTTITPEKDLWKLYDIFFHTPKIDKQTQTINSTIVLYFPRMEYQVSVLAEQIVPKKDKIEVVKQLYNNNKVYTLDAIVAVIKGHYFAYVNCTGTEEWLKYGADVGGQLKESYANFDELLKKEDIKSQATLLFYSSS